MENKSRILDKDVEEIGDKLLEYLGPIMSKISGEKIPKRLNKKDRDDLKNTLDFFSIQGEKKTALDNSVLPKNFKINQQIQFMDNLFANMLGIQDSNPTKLMIEQGDPKILYSRMLNSEKKANAFQKNIHDIYYKIGKLGRMSQFEKFQESIGIDTFISHSQSAERLNKHVKYLLRSRKRFSKRIIERHIDIFKESAGYLETLFFILYGMNLIIKNKYKPFKEIRNKYQIGSIVKELEKEGLFVSLVKPYNPHIRNSIQHSTHQIDSIEKKIEFFDREYHLVMDFADFVNYVQKIGVLEIMLSRIEYELSHLKFLEYQKYREIFFKN